MLSMASLSISPQRQSRKYEPTTLSGYHRYCHFDEASYNMQLQHVYGESAAKNNYRYRGLPIIDSRVFYRQPKTSINSSFLPIMQSMTSLPTSLLNANGGVAISFGDILHYDLVAVFAVDKLGCR